jgi:hypothetical protein
MPVAQVNGGGDGIALLVSAGIVYEIIAAACSSPQTTEINAGSRARTLMKWVYIGEAQAAVFVGLAAVIDRRHARAIIAGGVLAAVIMHCCYQHAKKCGLQSAEPGTEDTAGILAEVAVGAMA